MKNSRKILLVLFVLCIATTAFLMAACQGDKTVSKIEIESGFPESFEIDDSFPTDAKIKVTYSDDSTEIITVSSDMLIDFDTSTAGEHSIKVKYKEKELTYTYTVNEATAPITVTGIAVKSFPTSFEVGAAFPTDGKITVTYSDEHEEDITITASMVTGFTTAAVAEEITLTISYEGKSTTCKIAVVAPKTVTSIEITSFPEQVYVDAAFPTDGEITVHYSDGSKDENVEITAEMVSDWDTLVAEASEDITITVTYSDGITDTVVIDVVVAPSITSIEVKTFPATFKVGDDFPTADGAAVLTVYYSDSTDKEVKITSDMVSDFDTSEVAEEITLTISYEGLTTTFDIAVEAVVVAPSITSIEVKTFPATF
ncbi:MAG: bacterial Ig-like domain-containing protein, partial [Christensenellaceae bacterium]|nr:bacterial Ig-like domain-containing protein [Christensenellaceae bacterium]